MLRSIDKTRPYRARTRPQSRTSRVIVLRTSRWAARFLAPQALASLSGCTADVLSPAAEAQSPCPHGVALDWLHAIRNAPMLLVHAAGQWLAWGPRAVPNSDLMVVEMMFHAGLRASARLRGRACLGCSSKTTARLSITPASLSMVNAYSVHSIVNAAELLSVTFLVRRGRL